MDQSCFQKRVQRYCFFLNCANFLAKKMQFWNDFIKTNNHFAYFSRIDWLPRTRIRATRTYFIMYNVQSTMDNGKSVNGPLPYYALFCGFICISQKKTLPLRRV